MAKITKIDSVLGPVNTADLGATLTHEHLLVAPTGALYDSTLTFDREGQLLKIAGELKQLIAAGVSTIIDPIPLELGRDVDFMADVSQAAGINIICATGLYTDQGPFAGYPSYFQRKTADELAAIFVQEIEQGVGPRHVKPGVIKCATGPHKISQNEEKALRAGAQASKATGVPITTHTTDGSMGPEQMEIFMDEGLEPRKVTVGHCSDSADIPYLTRILDTGAFLGFDRVGIEIYTKDETKVGVMAALVAMGYTSQIVFSHDNVGCMHGMGPVSRFTPTPEAQSKRRYTYLLEEFVPKLKEAGVSEEAIRQILVDNPRRYFEGE